MGTHSAAGLKIKRHRTGCIQCGKKQVDQPDEKLKACGHCRSVKYCSQTCQATHWATHKKGCSIYAQINHNPAHVIRRCSDLAGLTLDLPPGTALELLLFNGMIPSCRVWQIPHAASDTSQMQEWERELATEFDFYNKPGDMLLEITARLTRHLDVNFPVGTLVTGHMNLTRMSVHIENDGGRLGENIRLYGTHPGNDVMKKNYARIGDFNYEFAQVLKTFTKAYDGFYEKEDAVIFYTHCTMKRGLGSYKRGDQLFSVDVNLKSGRARLLGKAGPEVIQLAPPVVNLEYEDPGM